MRCWNALCGTQTRTCSDECTWGDYGECTGVENASRAYPEFILWNLWVGGTHLQRLL